MPPRCWVGSTTEKVAAGTAGQHEHPRKIKRRHGDPDTTKTGLSSTTWSPHSPATCERKVAGVVKRFHPI